MTTPRKGTLLGLLATHMREHPGSLVTLGELVGITNGKQTTIQSYMNRLKTLLPELEVVTSGHAWRYMPNRGSKVTAIDVNSAYPQSLTQKKSAPLFAMLGTAKDGTVILESEAGSLWRATEL